MRSQPSPHKHTIIVSQIAPLGHTYCHIIGELIGLHLHEHKIVTKSAGRVYPGVLLAGVVELG